jgi:hypothetical protein
MENAEEKSVDLLFLHIFHIFSLLNLLFFHTFQILSLFNLLFSHIFLILFDLPFYRIFHIITQIWKILKKGKLNSGKIWKIKWWQTFVRNVIIEINNVIMKKNGGEGADNQ